MRVNYADKQVNYTKSKESGESSEQKSILTKHLWCQNSIFSLIFDEKSSAFETMDSYVAKIRMYKSRIKAKCHNYI